MVRCARHRSSSGAGPEKDCVESAEAIDQPIEDASEQATDRLRAGNRTIGSVATVEPIKAQAGYMIIWSNLYQSRISFGFLCIQGTLNNRLT